MKLHKAIGIDENGENIGSNKLLLDRINLQLIMLGFHVENIDEYTKNIVSPVISKTFPGLKKCNEEQCCADKRIERFLNSFSSVISSIDVLLSDFFQNITLSVISMVWHVCY